MEPTRRAMAPADPLPHPDWCRQTKAAYWWGKPDDRPQPLLPSAAQQRVERLATGRLVIICGGRAHADWERTWAALDQAHAAAPITLLVHGAGMDRTSGELQGVDRWVDGWAIEHQVASFSADGAKKELEGSERGRDGVARWDAMACSRCFRSRHLPLRRPSVTPGDQ